MEIAQSQPAAVGAPGHSGRGLRSRLLAATHLTIQSLALNVLSVPVIAYVVRRLGSTGFGQWSTANSLALSTLVITQLGLRGVFVRTVAKRPQSAADLLAEQLGTRMMLCMLAVAVALGVCLLLKYPLIILQCTAVSAIGLLCTTFVHTLTDLLQGLEHISVYAGITFIGGLVLTALSVVFVWVGLGPVGLSLAYLSGPVVGCVLLARFVHRELFPIRARFSLRRSWQLLMESKFIAAQQFAALGSNTESLVLPKMVGASDFGLYSAGALLATRLIVIPDSLVAAFYPAIAHSFHKDRALASREVMRVLLFAMMICLPVVVGGLFLSGPIAHILFGRNVPACQSVIRITLWLLPLAALENVMGYALNAASKDQWCARANFVAAPISVACAVVLMAKFGIIGAAWSIVVRSATKAAVFSYPFVLTFSPSLPVLRFSGLAACTGIMAAAMGLVHWMLPPLAASGVAQGRNWSELLINVGTEGMIGSIAYAVALLGLRILRPEDLGALLRRNRAGAN